MEITNRSCSVNLSIVSSFGSSKYWFLSYHQSCSSRPMKGARNLPSLKLTSNLPLKTNGWKINVLLGWLIFKGKMFVSGRVPEIKGFPSMVWKAPGPWFQHVSACGRQQWCDAHAPTADCWCQGATEFRTLRQIFVECQRGSNISG